jgi:hypothetical protein
LRRAFLVLVVFAFVFSVAGSALAAHKPGHREPPACDKPNPGPNPKHCYPPPVQREPAACSKTNPPLNNPNCEPASFVTQVPQQGGPALTVGMLLGAGALGGALLAARRRWTSWLRHT